MRRTIDLAAGLAAAEDQPAQALTLAELAHAYAPVTVDGSDTRLKKWTADFGKTSAWELTSEPLEAAAQAMLDHGYKTSAVNRDLSALGSLEDEAARVARRPRDSFPTLPPTIDVVMS